MNKRLQIASNKTISPIGRIEGLPGLTNARVAQSAVTPFHSLQEFPILMSPVV
jgi:hypothetical protein